MPEAVSILIADDHELVRRGLRDLLENVPGWVVCGEAANGRDAVALAKELRPQVAVLDLNMPLLSGLEAIRQLRRASKETEVLIFTGSEDESIIREVFTAGARSYILKSDISDHLVAAISSLARHKSYFTSRVSEIVFAKFLAPEAAPARITPREREVVQLLAEGEEQQGSRLRARHQHQNSGDAPRLDHAQAEPRLLRGPRPLRPPGKSHRPLRLLHKNPRWRKHDACWG